MSFKGGFITGQSISRRAGSSGGFGGAALSLVAVTQKSRSVIRPAPGGGGAPEPGVFKEEMADLGDGPTLEFLFNASNADRPGSDPGRWQWPWNTGTLQGTGIYFYDANLLGGATMTTEALDDFDGYAQMIDSDSYLSDLVDLPKDSALRTKARSWVYVWDNLDEDGDAAPLASDGRVISDTQPSFHGPGHILTSDLSSPEVIRIENNGDDIELNATNGTHSGGGSPVGCTLAAGIRTVLVVTYDGATSTTFRWKQTDDPSGHTYITQDTSAESTSGNTTWHYVGTNASAGAVINARYRYVGIVDHEITTGEFNTLALAARL